MSIAVKKIRFSADLDENGRPRSFVTQWILLQNGRRIDSFMSREAAERRAATLNRATPAPEAAE